MKSSFRNSFTRDLKKIKDHKLRDRIRAAIETVEAAESLQSLPDVKKIGGASNLFRIRIGEYRIGIALEGDTVDFVRCLNRRDLYRFFP